MSMKYRLDRRACVGPYRRLGRIGACCRSPVVAPKQQSLDKVSYQTNWRAQAEHGGFYYAVANGILQEACIDADIRMGGPQQNPSQLLLGGRVDMIMSNSFEAIRYVEENLPFLCIGSNLPERPAGHHLAPRVGHDSLAALKGKPILVAQRRTSFWPFLKAKFGFTERADQALHLQTSRRSWPTSRPRSRGSSRPSLRHRAAGHQARGASDRRCRVRELQHERSTSPARWWKRRRMSCSVSSMRQPRGGRPT